MADEGLLGVPMSFGIGDTLLGSLGVGLAKASPKMISPYASTGTAIGLGLGSVLLQSLLGYQARQQAADRTIELNKLSTPLLGMQTAQERSDYLSGLEDTDPLVLGRLSRLSGALGTRAIEQQQTLDLEKRKAELGLEMELSPMAQELAAQKQQRELQLIKERNAGLVSRFGRQPTSEREQFILDYFGRNIGVQAKADLLYLSDDDVELVKSGKLSIAQAMNKATRLGEEARRSVMNEQRKEFEDYKTYLKQTYKTLPAAIVDDVGKSNALYDRALNLSKLVSDKIKSIPQLQLEKRFTSDSGFREEFKDFTDLVQRARTGAAAPYVEQLNLQGIVTGTINATPQQVSKILSEFAKRLANDSYERVLTAQTPDNQLLSQLDNMRTKLVPFLPKVPKLKTPETLKTSVDTSNVTKIPKRADYATATEFIEAVKQFKAQQ